MGLVIDNCGSMREKRAQVNAAAITFVETSNPQDEAFVVNFNDEFYLDTDGEFTSDEQDLQDAFAASILAAAPRSTTPSSARSTTSKKGHKDKRVLLVITDGDDDASA